MGYLFKLCEEMADEWCILIMEGERKAFIAQAGLIIILNVLNVLIILHCHHVIFFPTRRNDK